MFDFNFIHNAIDSVSGIEKVREAKEGLKAVCLFVCIGTVVVLGSSIGIQYLVFRVWG